MAVNTVTALDILRRVADETGETRSAFVDNVATTTLRCAGLSLGDKANFKHALATIEGKGTRTVSAYYEADETIVVDTAFSSAAAGDVVTLCWWDANKLGVAKRAILQSIRASYPYWYREVILDLNNNTMADGTTTFTMLSFASGDNEYTLPSDVAFLARIGAQAAATSEPRWMRPLQNWRVVGQEGNLKLRFNPVPVDIASQYAGETIALHYEAREPVFSTFTASDTTQLPLDYFSVAAEIYRRYSLKNADDVALMQWATIEANKTLTRLGFVKKPLPRGPKYEW